MTLTLIRTATPRVASPYLSMLQEKARRLDALGDRRALAVLSGLADHFLGTTTASHVERRLRIVARLRACGAELTTAYLEREGTHG
jgi:hypothetical protein